MKVAMLLKYFGGNIMLARLDFFCQIKILDKRSCEIGVPTFLWCKIFETFADWYLLVDKETMARAMGDDVEQKHLSRRKALILLSRWRVNIVHSSHFSQRSSSYALSVSELQKSGSILSPSSRVGGSALYHLFVVAFLRAANIFFIKDMNSWGLSWPRILFIIQFPGRSQNSWNLPPT